VTRIELPDFGVPDHMPELPSSIYALRLERLRERMEGRGLERLVIYADREHSANLAWLTGFDPRFEEALLVLEMAVEPALLVGTTSAGARPGRRRCRCAATWFRTSAYRASRAIAPGRWRRS
jgi:Creatinase/Prolidase N-terminal domain.